MQLVDNHTFLQQLGALFESTKDKGTIWLTHKRLTHDGDDTVMKEEDGSDGSREYPCIVKFSTKILSTDLDKFHSAYGALLKASMITLRKRDKKREKQRAEQLAKKKQRMADPVVINGPKRGNGRRKRQRQVKAALKHEDMKERAAKREEARTKQ
ncbi:signal recognition particle SRP9/SRP14 subunit [Suillus subaureus]|uniref:Signal recognition particle subunit SRP14 n=1 Tax=Suillus subaureus TaxID=48587 RepID=A0A9P7DX92_9AGAM|nr:signal recognition particle SRP9/SRP14 subunit [Suillus subaureus]KAG1805556.1 signal recognition particle SRP9/SRP14 subunit [Suillus subaureus]